MKGNKGTPEDSEEEEDEEEENSEEEEERLISEEASIDDPDPFLLKCLVVTLPATNEIHSIELSVTDSIAFAFLNV